MGGLIYLLDINTISEPTKPSSNQQVIAHLKKFEGQFSLPVFAICKDKK